MVLAWFLFFCLYRNEANSYRIINLKKNELWNRVFKDHREQHPNCRGYLSWDLNKEEQWGFGWCETAICSTCTYISPKFKLYNEIETEKRGRKCADINLGIQIGLTQTSIGPTALSKILLCGNIPAPSQTGMQNAAIQASKTIIAANTDDMKERREGLKKINLENGQPENIINAESDGIYNNPLYSGCGKTPFQPSTQCTYIVAENVTANRQIIAIENENKLCSKYGMHTAESMMCDVQAGPCTATTPMESSIGNEEKYAKKCFESLLSDNIEVKYLTTDPDTKSFKAVQSLYTEKKSSTEPCHLIDTRHFSQNHRKFIGSKNFVLEMMPGETVKKREKLRRSFATDLSMRCQAEFNTAFKTCNGNLGQLNASMPHIIDSVVDCNLGNHTKCKLYSGVCSGTDNDNWLKHSTYLSSKFAIDPIDLHRKNIRKCINYRLGPEALAKTQLNSNSQKVEASNKVIRRSLPRSNTFARGFPARAHSAIHSVNNGPGMSVYKLCRSAGCDILSGTKVCRRLKQEQKLFEQRKERQKLLLHKIKRKYKRVRLYQLYDKQQEKVMYSKGQLLNRRTSKKNKACKLPDHTYHYLPQHRK